MDQTALSAALALARKQHGFITWDQALEAGLSPFLIRRLVSEGHWEKLGRGLYRVNGVKETWHGRLMAASLRAGDRAAISHRSAAALWGLEGFHPSKVIDVTVPRSRRHSFDDVVVHRRNLARIGERDGIPVTPIPETILDLCATSRDRSIPSRALDDVRRRHLVTPFQLRRCLLEHRGRGHCGSAVFRELLEQRFGKTPAGTVFAAEVLDLLVAAGLPGRRSPSSVSGRIGHLNERAFEEDPVRNNDFAIDGWLQLWVTYRRKEEQPERVVADVRDALACRGGV